MQPNETHETIAQYIHHMQPPHLKPGIDIGMALLDDESVIVHVPPLFTIAVISYRRGPDLFDVTISDGTPKVREYSGIYCDQLGELVFGKDAGEWTMPFGTIVVLDDDGNPTAVHEI